MFLLGFVWDTLHSKSATIPSPRYGASSVIQGDKIFLYGGVVTDRFHPTTINQQRHHGKYAQFFLFNAPLCTRTCCNILLYQARLNVAFSRLQRSSESCASASIARRKSKSRYISRERSRVLRTCEHARHWRTVGVRYQRQLLGEYHRPIGAVQQNYSHVWCVFIFYIT